MMIKKEMFISIIFYWRQFSIKVIYFDQEFVVQGFKELGDNALNLEIKHSGLPNT